MWWKLKWGILNLIDWRKILKKNIGVLFCVEVSIVYCGKVQYFCSVIGLRQTVARLYVFNKGRGRCIKISAVSAPHRANRPRRLTEVNLTNRPSPNGLGRGGADCVVGVG